MSYDLSGHFQFGHPFEEKGHFIKAWQPANEQAKREFVVQAFLNSELTYEIVLPMRCCSLYILSKILLR